MYGDLAGKLEHAAERSVVELALHQKRVGSRQQDLDERTVEPAGVIPGDQYRPARRQVFQTADLDPEQQTHQHRRQPPNAGKRDRLTSRIVLSPRPSTVAFVHAVTAVSRSRTCRTTWSAFMDVESMTTASGACVSGEAARPESAASRRRRSASVAANAAESGALPTISRPRRTARAGASAVRKTFSVASGATVVPMSRPSTTIPPSPMSSCCRRTIARRTAGIALTVLTLAVTGAVRTAEVTSVPSTATAGASGSVWRSSTMRTANSATACSFAGSMPCSRTVHVSARYIAPVSR